MEHAVVFDTYAYVKKLKSVGFTEEQAAVQAETIKDLIDDKLATKRDLKDLELALKRDLKELEAATKRDLKELELRLTVKLGAIMAAGIAAVAAIVKLA
jgi:hypothetical protein